MNAENLALAVTAAQALCHVAPEKDAHRLTLQLPFLQLDLCASRQPLRDLCVQSLVETTVHQATPRIGLWLTDLEQRKDLSLPQLDLAAIGLGAVIAAFEAAGLDGSYDNLYENWQVFDANQGCGVQVLAQADAMAPWDRAFPLRNFLHWAYAAQGRRLLHAGSLGLGSKGVLIAGAGGAGKSGTTLAGLLHGLGSVGDDYLVADHSDAGLQVHAIMRLMKQDPAGMARLGLAGDPHLAGPLNWQGKHEFDYAGFGPQARAAMLDISAILLPRIAGNPKSALRPASPREVLFALLPNNLKQLPGRHQQAMSFLTAIVRDLPGYHLDLGHDPTEIADTIGRFIESR